MKHKHLHVRLPEHMRAWVEVDLDALSHNAKELKSFLPQGCEMIVVLKADAYGHGHEKCALRLQRDGIKNFAVATATEGVQLRKCGITGNILVLGYTQPIDAHILEEFSLAQVVVDGVHAKGLNESGYALNVHVGIDTGMHRLGIEHSKLEEIESVFNYPNLKVVGMATHLASSDSTDESDIEFTNLQLSRLTKVVETLKEKGYNVGKVHAQASYGIINYSESNFDYARAGIMLYGVKSFFGGTKTEPNLQPVLSLKANIAQVREIAAGESVGYSRTYTAEKQVKIATVCLGYADGLPRLLSGKGGKCIVCGKLVPIVGRISMDMVTIDVTDVPDVSPGDVAIFIGKEGDLEIRAETIAESIGTIAYEIISRMGTRPPRLYINDTQ